MPYLDNVFRAFSGRSMMPIVMISVPTVGWPRRADSFWAVTSAPMHSSDIRSNIMEREVDDDFDLDDAWLLILFLRRLFPVSDEVIEEEEENGGTNDTLVGDDVDVDVRYEMEVVVGFS